MFSAAEGSVKQGPGASSFLGSFSAKRAFEGIKKKKKVSLFSEFEITIFIVSSFFCVKIACSHWGSYFSACNVIFLNVLGGLSTPLFSL